MDQNVQAPARGMDATRPWEKTSWIILAAWAALVGVYAVVSLVAGKGPRLTAFGDIFQCAAALFAVVCLLLNTSSEDNRTRTFWILLTLGCAMWLSGQIVWTYFEVYLRHDVPNPFLGDVVLFLHPVPMMAALAAKPHDARNDLNVRLQYLDFSLLLVWWVYLYMFVVIPWQYISPDVMRYGLSYDHLAVIEDLLLTVGFAALWKRVRGPWKEIYAHLFCASLLYAVASYATNRAIDDLTYYTGSIFDLPLVASFVWFGTAGIVAHRLKPKPEIVEAPSHETNRWAARVAMAAVLSVPLMALWSLLRSSDLSEVRTFRIGVTQGALVLIALMMFLRQSLVDRDRMRLLEASHQSFENLKHFQYQMIQTEKLVSLGQLAAGAAHEINNPLAGILGYSDLLVDDATLGERQRAVADKIRTLARRIKLLVTSLLSFARQVPSEKTQLNVNSIVASALHLSNLDLRGAQIEVENLADPKIPLIYGDANHILQVLFNLISNAVDALEESGGGRLTVRTAHDAQFVRIEVSDTGPGVKSPQQVFDPFFTTKPVGKGTGLGLSICYGIVQDHGGHIECLNRSEGGATFVVELPYGFNLPVAPREPAIVHAK